MVLTFNRIDHWFLVRSMKGTYGKGWSCRPLSGGLSLEILKTTSLMIQENSGSTYTEITALTLVINRLESTESISI